MNTMEIEDNETDLRAKLQNAVAKAKETCERLEQKTVAAARTADTAVRSHPYQAAGIAFGLGVLLGVLWKKTRPD